MIGFNFRAKGVDYLLVSAPTWVQQAVGERICIDTKHACVGQHAAKHAFSRGDISRDADCETRLNYHGPAHAKVYLI